VTDTFTGIKKRLPVGKQAGGKTIFSPRKDYF
jgi:hypothetical protein